MHVGIVTPRFPPNAGGGGAISARLLANVLSERSEIEDVTVFAFDGEGPEEMDGVRVVRHHSPAIFSFEVLNVFAYIKLQSTLREHGIDVLHSYNMRLHPVVGHLSNKYGIPSVGTLNSYAFIPNEEIGISDTDVLDWYKRIFLRSTGKVLVDRMRQIDSFVAISTAIANIYRDQLLADSRVDVIPNMCEPGVGSAVESSTNDSRTDRDENCEILYVGALRPTKGVEYLVRAVEHLPGSYRVSIAGEGGEKRELQHLATRLGVSDQITFLGRVSHESVPSLYQEANVFVHPGVWPEPFGRTILEAMQFGLPVVATDIGGPAEVIPHEECLCEPRDPEGLAEAIQAADSRRTAIGRKNSTYVRENYSPDVIAPRIIDMYRSI